MLAAKLSALLFLATPLTLVSAQTMTTPATSAPAPAVASPAPATATPPGSGAQTAPMPVATPVAPTPATAEAVAEKAERDRNAKVLFTQADQAYKIGNYELALVLFKESYALSNRPLILIALANTQERLADLSGALTSLKLYMASTAGSNSDPGIPIRIRHLEERARRAKPQPVVKPLVATAAPLNPTTTVKASEQARWPWYLAGGGATALATGIGFALAANSARGDAESRCEELGGKNLCLPSAQNYIDKDAKYSLIADLSIGLGVAALATSAFFLTQEGSESRSGTSGTTTSFAVAQDQLSLVVSGAF